MMYKITIKDINTNEVFEYEINDISELRKILQAFENKTIGIELHRVGKKILKK